MNEKFNYKLVFFIIFVAYNIAQVPIILFKPELTKYLTVLQVFMFLIPLIFLHISSDNEVNSIKSFYKLNFRFDLIAIPCILWALFGIYLLDIGLAIISYHILPEFILEIIEKLLDTYHANMSDFVTIGENWIKDLIVLGTCVAVIPAICEEFLFRGYLMQNIFVKNSKHYAIVFSALIFGLVHVNPIAILSIFIMGIFLGKLFYSTNSIIPSILFHFLNNFIAFLVTNFVESSAELNAELYVGILLFLLSAVILAIVYSILSRIEAKL